MNNGISKLGVFASIVVTIGVAIFFPFIEDPVSTAGTFNTGDNRENRLGSLSHEQTTTLQNNLLNQTSSTERNIRVHAIGKLVTTYRQRTMISDSLFWLKKGLKEFPNDPHLLNEKQLMTEIIKRNM